jgi:uncharacterized protein YciI
MFAITLTYLKPLDAVDALLPAHIEWLQRHYASGLLLASGRQRPRIGGFLLARSGDRAALDRALSEDPFAREGVARYDVIEVEVSKVAPGFEPLLGC